MIKVENVSFNYPNGSRSGVEDINLDVNTGDFYLMIGKTGAGKTTLIKLLSRELVPDKGEIYLKELKSSRLKQSYLPIWRRNLGVVYQDLRLLNDRTALENVILTANCDPNQHRPRERAIKTLALVGLSHKFNVLPKELSTGEQQRVAIARALVNEPLVLLADEPVSNLDSETSMEIVKILQHVNRMGTAVVVITHQPERFIECNPKTLKMDAGRLQLLS